MKNPKCRGLVVEIESQPCIVSFGIQETGVLYASAVQTQLIHDCDITPYIMLWRMLDMD